MLQQEETFPSHAVVMMSKALLPGSVCGSGGVVTVMVETGVTFVCVEDSVPACGDETDHFLPTSEPGGVGGALTTSSLGQGPPSACSAFPASISSPQAGLAAGMLAVRALACSPVGPTHTHLHF